MRYSLAVKDKEKFRELLGNLYDPDSSFCVYEPGEEVPEGKFLIVISDKAMDLPNVVFYVPNISVLLNEKQIVNAGFPEEESGRIVKIKEKAAEKEHHNKGEEKQKIPVGEDLFAVEKKKDKIVQPEPEVVEPQVEEQARKPAVKRIIVNRTKQIKKTFRKEVKKIEKSNVLLVGDVETALTVAVSVHKLKPFMKVVIEDEGLAEQYGVIDQNLVAVSENEHGQGEVVIKVKNGENSGLEQYKGQQYSNWKEIARRALSRIR